MDQPHINKVEVKGFRDRFPMYPGGEDVVMAEYHRIGNVGQWGLKIRIGGYAKGREWLKQGSKR